MVRNLEKMPFKMKSKKLTIPISPLKYRRNINVTTI